MGLIERVAKAIYEAEHMVPLPVTLSDLESQGYMSMARAAIEAITKEAMSKQVNWRTVVAKLWIEAASDRHEGSSRQILISLARAIQYGIEVEESGEANDDTGR
jgi:hypothetical protein